MYAMHDHLTLRLPQLNAHLMIRSLKMLKLVVLYTEMDSLFPK